MTDTPPTGPTGVWLKYADGEIVKDVPTIYVGTDADGIAHFELLLPRDESPVSAGAAVWPGMTSLALPMLAPGTEIP